MFTKLYAIFHSPTDYLWRSNIDQLSRWRQKLNGMLRHLYALSRDFFDGQLNLHAMSLVFTTLLALVPLIAVSFSVLKAFGVHNQLEPVLLQFLAPLGDKGIEITKNIIAFVENVKAGVLGSIGLLFLFYTVISLIQKVESTFNYIWQVESGRTLIRRISDYLSITVIGPVFVFSAIAITASVIGNSMVQDILAVSFAAMLFDFATRLIPYLLIISVFTFVYVFMPNTKVKFTAALTGGIVAGIIWQTSSWLFAKFVVAATSYAAIYSGFAIVIVFMLWIYLNWLILLIGSTVAFYTQFPESMLVKRDATPVTIVEKENLSLSIVYLIARNHYKGGVPMGVNALVSQLGVPVRLIQLFLDNLEAGRILVRTSGVESAYLPAVPMEKTTVKQVLDVIRSTEPYLRMIGSSKKSIPMVDTLFARMNQSVENTLDHLTIARLVEEGERTLSC